MIELIIIILFRIWAIGFVVALLMDLFLRWHMGDRFPLTIGETLLHCALWFIISKDE